jgi:hypothetical protein
MVSLRRRRTRWVALLGSFVLLGAAAIGVAEASPAHAATTITISLTNAPKECIDVWNNNHAAGAELNLWTCPGPSGQWIERTGFSCIANQQTNCFEFEDAHNTRLCIGAPVGTGGYLTLQTCGSSNSRTTWYSEGGGHIGSGAYGSLETIAAAGGSNLDKLVAMNYPPPSGYWWTWSY